MRADRLFIICFHGRNVFFYKNVNLWVNKKYNAHIWVF